MASATSLCPHLQPLLDAELAAGNAVKDRGPSPSGQGGRLVLLSRPFMTSPETVPDLVRYTRVNDPHWWLAEYGCTEHHDMLACAF